MHWFDELTTALAICLALTLSGRAFAGPDPEPKGAQAGRQAPSEDARRTFTREELPGPPVPEEATIPTGTRADVLLWKQTMDAQNELQVQRPRAEALLRRFHRERHDARLAQLVNQAPEGERARLHAVRKRLGFAWKDVNDLIARPWPVDARLSCRAQFHDLEGAMAVGRAGESRAGLAEARVAVKACLKKVQSVLDPLRTANQTLSAAFVEADAALAPGAPDAGVGAARDSRP
jgi:hypothetical protein